MFKCDFDIFQCGILCQLWCLVVLIPDLCRLSYFSRPIIAKCRSKVVKNATLLVQNAPRGGGAFCNTFDLH